MSDEEARRLVRDIVTYTGVREKRPGEVTYMDMMAEWGITKSGSEYRLGKMVREGILETGLVYDQERHKTVRVWWAAEGHEGWRGRPSYREELLEREDE